MVEIRFKRTQVRVLMLGGTLVGPKVGEVDRLFQIGPIVLFRCLSVCFSCAVGI